LSPDAKSETPLGCHKLGGGSGRSKKKRKKCREGNRKKIERIDFGKHFKACDGENRGCLRHSRHWNLRDKRIRGGEEVALQGNGIKHVSLTIAPRKDDGSRYK